MWFDRVERNVTRRRLTVTGVGCIHVDGGDGVNGRYRAVVIGLGRMGSTIDDERGKWASIRHPSAHTPCYQAVGIEVVAGADPHAGQRDAYRAKWGIETLYEDYREMVERERPDLVSICTSARPRAQVLLDVIEIGASRGLKGIWAEKPLCISLDEGDQMVEACRKAGIVFAVGCSRNWSPYYDRMRELVDSGELGELLQIVSQGEAFVSHNGSHLLALTNRLVGGRVKWVFGHMDSDENTASDNDLQGNGYLHYENGVQGFVRMMPCGASNWQFELIGTLGRLNALADAQEVEFHKLQASGLEGRGEGPARLIFPQPPSVESDNTRTVRDLISCIETGKVPNCSGADGLHVLEIAIAMRESHRRGGIRVDLPLADRALRIFSRETDGDSEPRAIRNRTGNG